MKKEYSDNTLTIQMEENLVSSVSSKTLETWKEWLGELPWLLKWFPLLIVLRPIVDSLYFLKEVSPLLSPPYLVGVLTPILAIAALAKFHYPNFGRVDKAFAFWSVLVLLNCFFILLYDPLSILSLEFLLKLSLPVYLFFFISFSIVGLFRAQTLRKRLPWCEY